MKGVKFLTDKNNKRVAVQIELAQLEKHQEEIEDFLDVIIAESRMSDDEEDWEVVKKRLRT
jgi:hypothetical protein